MSRGSEVTGGLIRYILGVGTRQPPIIGIGTSVLFASITLGVFVLNQYGGPESVTSLFVRSVAAGNDERIRGLVVGDPGIAVAIVQQVAEGVRFADGFLVTSVRRRGDVAIVSLTWLRGNVRRVMMLPLVKTETGWKVDARHTTWGLG